MLCRMGALKNEPIKRAERPESHQCEKMFSSASVVSVIVIIASVSFCDCASGTTKTFEETRKSLLKQEERYLSVNTGTRDSCEQNTCASQYTKLSQEISSKGKSNMAVSTAYQDCMLSCIRSKKPKQAAEAYSDGSSPLSDE
uniref:Uncharacterized protein n=1 Tax=Trichuris muris TaxID=70415 RepID=A0A5S6QRS1_TRIMR